MPSAPQRPFVVTIREGGRGVQRVLWGGGPVRRRHVLSEIGPEAFPPVVGSGVFGSGGGDLGKGVGAQHFQPRWTTSRSKTDEKGESGEGS